MRIVSQMRSLQRDSTSTQYHRGSMAMLITYLKSGLDANWNSTMKYFFELVMQDKASVLRSKFMQELLVQLHILGVYKLPDFPSSIRSHFVNGLGSWKSLQQVVCITIEVLRSKLRVFTDIAPQQFGMLTIQCSLRTSPSSLY